MILVVGGAGYIGSHTNRLLDERGYQTVVFDNLETGHADFVQWGQFFKGDLRNIEDIRRCFALYPKIEAVIHFAAYAYVGESVHEPKKYYHNNVLGTMNLLNVMQEFHCQKIIFSSTCATYGVPMQTPITEKHIQAPINPYGKTKYMIELMLEDYARAYGLRYVIFRYFNAAGASRDALIGEDHTPETHLIPLVLDVALGKRECIEVFGDDYETVDGTCIRDYIHVEDLALAHVLGLEYLHTSTTSNIFNLGNGIGFSVKEIIASTEKVVGQKIPIKVAFRREGDPAKLIGSFQKAKEILGWEPSYKAIEDIIATAWNWHQKRIKI